jgi:hypothetical protein
MNHSLQKTISRLFSYFFFLLPLQSRKLSLPRRSKPMRIRKIQFLTRTVLTFFLISYFFFLVSFFSCEKTTAPLNKLQLTLSAEYVGVTEADLRLQTKNNEANTQYQLFRDDSLISDGALIQAETLISDTLLLPAHHYSYQAFLIKDEKQIAQSEEQQVTTLDTTSHDFNWDILTIGIYPSRLYDVAIINENDIWAVGEIYADSTQPSFRYNAVHWEGAQWRLQRITVRFRDSDITPPGEGIFVFSNSDIWVTLGGAPAHWDGSNWTLYHLWDMGVLTQNDGGVTRIWGSLPDNVYFAGRGGTIVHYNGGSWQKLENPAGAGGTEVDLLDVWGSPDGRVVWACGYTDYVGTVLLKISGNSVEKVYDDNDYWFITRQDSLSGVLTSLWTDNPNILFLISPNGMYRAPAVTRGQADRLWYNNGHVPGFPYRLRGTAVNDMIVVGDYRTIVHYNGYSWRYYDELNSIARLRSVDVRDNLVVAVGADLENGIGLIVTGTRF